MAASAAPEPADIVALARGCRFADCRHDQEPGCAVRGVVDERRLAEWRALEHERRRAQEREDQRRARGRTGSRMVREALRAKGRR